VVDYDPFSQEVMDDPLPVYRRLRDESPVHYLPRHETWALSRFEDVWRASEDDEHLTALRGTSWAYLVTRSIPALPNLNHMDPPAQTALRAELAPWFMPRRVRRFEPAIRASVRELIQSFEGEGRADVATQLAQRVAVQVACMAVGFPEADAAYIVDLVKRFLSREEGLEEMTQKGVDAFGEMIAYLEGLARERRRHTGEPANPIDVLIRTRVEGESLSDEVIGQHLVLMLVGGTETFPKSFCSAALRLAQHPDQRAELVAEPARIPQALRECLRYDTPTQFLMRSVKRDFEMGGQQLREGQSVMFLYPSANRDHREFDEPDRFDIHRRSPRILTFGQGGHRCLGGHFAEMEGKVLLEEMLSRFPAYEVDEGGIVYDRTEFIRGMAHLPIEFEPVGV